jgi:3-oxoadipate enol-lactonase
VKPVLVLPSSLGTTAELWDVNVPHWADSFRVLPYDQRGRSSIAELGADLITRLDERDIERASMCGLSLGGATAMWVAANAPDRVDRLVLACTSARFGEPGPWLERAAVVRGQGLEPIAETIVARWLTPAAPRELVERFRRMLVATPREAYAACCDALARWDFREHLAEITPPTLVIAGAEDAATPLEHAEVVAGGIPNAGLIVLPDAAHLGNVEQAETFSRLVAGHLAGVEVA